MKKRFFMLVTSFTGIMAILAGTLAAYSYAYLAGYNSIPRIVMSQPVAQEYQKSLREAAGEIKASIQEIGVQNIPTETQRRLAKALAGIEQVDKALEPSESSEPAIFLPELGLLASPAFAEEATARVYAKEDFRQNLAMVLLVAITLFWLVCLSIYFFSKDEKKIAFAANMIQTVLGFYIGVFTGLMGLPVAAG
ncbi:hypothetical protein B5K05_09810 [Rhizobium phaseoli]|nr:hypothetical protein B5K04_09780 [Rhizobium phaseoli]RDJ16439.1 hypothetical protein B5K05_09810 [Rhizobium phaseoli]